MALAADLNEIVLIMININHSHYKNQITRLDYIFIVFTLYEKKNDIYSNAIS